MDLGRAAEPDMTTYLGVDVTQTLGPLFWGASFLRCGYYGLLNI
jgi:hypothetical protein